MDTLRSIIIGFEGEVGSAIKEILQEAYPDHVSGIDVHGKHTDSFGSLTGSFDIMHICFGHSKDFIKIVQEYQKRYQPTYTVIHSTVPLGTTEILNHTSYTVHSPIRGLHPKLKQGILTFPKFIGGPAASHVADYFRKAGMKVVIFDRSATTEALKLFDTEYYRHCIEFAQRVKKYCDKHQLNFSEVYTIPNITYNEGYTELGYPEYVRPVLQPIMKEIGGHCLLPNQKLIKEHE